jgi:hypothetical protein
MKPSSGNPVRRPADKQPQNELRPSAPRADEAARPDYRKPELKRLGLLRSVTGSDLKW